MQQNGFDMQRPADPMREPQTDVSEQSCPAARWENWKKWGNMITLSGEPSPVTVPRPLDWRPLSELPDELQKKVSRQQTSVQTGVGCLCYMLPFFAAIYMWSNGSLKSFISAVIPWSDDSVDFLDFLLIVGIAGTMLLLLLKIILIHRAAPDSEIAASYVWFYGQIDDLVSTGQSMGSALSVNGYEIPLQMFPPGVAVINRSRFSEGSKWLLNTDIIVVQEDSSEGVKTPNFLIFPALNNKLIHNRIIVIRR